MKSKILTTVVGVVVVGGLALLAGCAESGRQRHILIEDSHGAAYRLSANFSELDAIKAAAQHCETMGRKAVLRRSDKQTAAFDCK